MQSLPYTDRDSDEDNENPRDEHPRADENSVCGRHCDADVPRPTYERKEAPRHPFASSRCGFMQPGKPRIPVDRLSAPHDVEPDVQHECGCRAQNRGQQHVSTTTESPSHLHPPPAV